MERLPSEILLCVFRVILGPRLKRVVFGPTNKKNKKNLDWI